VQVRYRCESIERLTLIDPSDVGSSQRSTRALELVSKRIAIRRVSARNRESTIALNTATRKAVDDVWSRCRVRPSFSAGASHDSTTANRPPLDPIASIQVLASLGPSPWEDDALFSMALAARTCGDDAAAGVFLDEVRTRFPNSTGAARTNAYVTGGARYLARSGGGW
jgi:hypothetical protein